MAERMLEIVREKVLEDERLVSVFPDYRRIEATETDENAELLAGELINAMRVRRDGAPEGPSRTLIAGRG
jgi:hypothetical protein